MKQLFCLFLFIGVFFNTYILAQPELDTTFNSTGRGYVAAGFIGSPNDVITQPDNKIIFTSNCRTINVQSFPFCLVRLNEDGTTDLTFGVPRSGVSNVMTNIPEMSPDSGTSTDMALQNDGKIVVVGYGRFSGIDRAILVRYTSNGNLDTSFGGTGIIINTAIASAVARAVVIQPDGRILIVGYAGTSSFVQFVARYNPNGMPDTTFGINGVATINVAGNTTFSSAIALQPDGKIVIGGYIRTNSGTPSYLLARFNSDGTLDTAFDEDGLKSIEIGGSTTYSFVAVAVQTDGRIVALGNNILYRVNSDGSLDLSFDGDGSRTALSPGVSESRDMIVTPSGKITVVGLPLLQNGPPFVYRTARYLPNGSPDPGFSNDGYLDIDATDSVLDGAYVVAADSRGRIVIGGRSADGNLQIPWENSRYSAARLIASPAQNVGFSGKVTTPDGTPVLNAFITLQNGSEIVGITRTNPFGYFRFKNIQSAQTYTLSTRAKGLNFADRNVLVDDEITNYTIIGNDLPILIQGK